MTKTKSNNNPRLGMLQYLCRMKRLTLQEKEELKMRIAIAIEQATKE